jgi:hypothetical protein
LITSHAEDSRVATCHPILIPMEIESEQLQQEVSLPQLNKSNYFLEASTQDEVLISNTEEEVQTQNKNKMNSGTETNVILEKKGIYNRSNISQGGLRGSQRIINRAVIKQNDPKKL